MAAGADQKVVVTRGFLDTQHRVLSAALRALRARDEYNAAVNLSGEVRAGALTELVARQHAEVYGLLLNAPPTPDLPDPSGKSTGG